MTSNPEPTGGTGSTRAQQLDALLAEATRQLRAQPEPRAVEIADAVLKRSLATPRPAVLVRAAPPHEHVKVSSTVVVALVRERVDAVMRDASVGRVLLDVTRQERLEAMTLELLVRYGTPIMDVADQARALAREVLVEVLGPGAVGAEVLVEHVHVSDVTRGDPHEVDPADERPSPGR